MALSVYAYNFILDIFWMDYFLALLFSCRAVLLAANDVFFLMMSIRRRHVGQTYSSSVSTLELRFAVFFFLSFAFFCSTLGQTTVSLCSTKYMFAIRVGLHWSVCSGTCYRRLFHVSISSKQERRNIFRSSSRDSSAGMPDRWWNKQQQQQSCAHTCCLRVGVKSRRLRLY